MLAFNQSILKSNQRDNPEKTPNQNTNTNHIVPVAEECPPNGGWIDDGSAARPLLVQHIPKAGGESLRYILNWSHFDFARFHKLALWSHNKIVHSGVNRLFARLRKNQSSFFKIGMTRSPCDYILSLWLFQGSSFGQRNHAIQHECLKKKLGYQKERHMYAKNVDKPNPTKEELDRFKKWVFLSAGRRIHYLGYRQYIALYRNWAQNERRGEHDENFHWPRSLLFAHCLNNLTDAEEEDAFDSLATFNISERYDCIVRTEHNNEDVRKCLRQYAAEQHNPELRSKMWGDICRSTQNPIQATSRKRGGACCDFYDAGLEEFVWQLEGPLARRFGYTSCCFSGPCHPH